ncbi:hypothetical protein B0T20DRAFT_483809 [Sordaria brevicollis]|uniref:Uncharacterized protein n=1 Tax=Sordaria brevicollis TaxID=83679 RepID=A0AAE0NWL6_SORBR|nr:hypothetical protein B0T20DRAFT_483809 [Sordaria brevicollis]
MSRQDDGRSYGLKAPGSLVIGSSCVRKTSVQGKVCFHHNLKRLGVFKASFLFHIVEAQWTFCPITERFDISKRSAGWMFVQGPGPQEIGRAEFLEPNRLVKALW